MEVTEKLPPDFKAKWIAALRSGEYKQGKDKLHHDGRFCCLGVGCVVAGIEVSQLGTYCYPSVLARLNPSLLPPLFQTTTHSSACWKLATMNDGKGDNITQKSFTQIADWIEQNL
jgi:hypothetical protein